MSDARDILADTARQMGYDVAEDVVSNVERIVADHHIDDLLDNPKEPADD